MAVVGSFLRDRATRASGDVGYPGAAASIVPIEIFRPEQELVVTKLEQNSALLGRHPDRSIQPDHFAIQHRVFDDVASEGGIFLRAAEARGERDHCA